MNLQRIFMLGSLIALAVAACVVYGLLFLKPTWDVKQAVRMQLNDPESAQFSDITLHPNRATACGYVNAKNQMGGYAGRKKFKVVSGVVLFDTDC